MTGAVSKSRGLAGSGPGLVGVVLGTLLVAACTGDSVTPVDPNAGNPDGTSTPPHPTAQRPAELSLAGVDPCSLFTDPQLDRLKVNSRPRLAEHGRDGRTCALDVDLTAPYYSYYVETITDADLREWTGGEHAKSSVTTTEPIEVAGFPAVTKHADSSAPSDCETYVGVADGQTLRVQIVPTAPDDFTQVELCDMATQAAELAMQTMQTMQR